MNTEVERDMEGEMNEQDVEARVDLNLADVVELATVPGIGPTLASRIIAYREEHGPFLLSEEVIAVAGIGQATYENMRDHVKATLPEEFPPVEDKTETEGEETMMEEGEVQTPAEEQKEALTTPPPEDETAVTEKAESAPPAEEEIVEGEAMPASQEPAAALEPALPPPEPEPEPQPEPPPEPPPEPAPAPPPPAASKSPPAIKRKLWITGVLAAFAGGLLGMLFALLVFAGLNGSLDLNQADAIVGLRTQLDTVTMSIDTLNQDVDGLRERLDTLEGLTTRMDEAEAAIETLQDDVSTLDENVASLQQETQTLQDEVKTLSDDLAKVTEDVERATTFFERLRTLIIDVFGEEPTSASPESEK